MLDRIKKYQSKTAKLKQKCQTQGSKRRFKIKTFNFMDQLTITEPTQDENKKEDIRLSYSGFHTTRNSKSQLQKLRVSKAPEHRSQSRKSDKIKQDKGNSVNSNNLEMIDVEKFLFHITEKHKNFGKIPNLPQQKLKNYSGFNSHRAMSSYQDQRNYDGFVKNTKILASKGKLQRIDDVAINQDLMLVRHLRDF